MLILSRLLPDSRNRLLSTTDPLGKIERYAYDGNDNLIKGRAEGRRHPVCLRCRQSASTETLPPGASRPLTLDRNYTPPDTLSLPPWTTRCG
ncbi:MAG: RHS repeat protein, partial [Nitrospira sp.]|nr:RHS repeat protein [Nitrospira sp.]